MRPAENLGRFTIPGRLSWSSASTCLGSFLCRRDWACWWTLAASWAGSRLRSCVSELLLRRYGGLDSKLLRLGIRAGKRRTLRLHVSLGTSQLWFRRL